MPGKRGILTQGGKEYEEYLEAMKDITICEPVVTIKSAVKEDTLKVMEELADKLV